MIRLSLVTRKIWLVVISNPYPFPILVFLGVNPRPITFWDTTLDNVRKRLASWRKSFFPKLVDKR